jgi:hypothetical protein
LIVSSGPALRVETIGPASVIVGKEAIYTVVVHNEGTLAAQGVLVHVGRQSTCG